MMVSLSPMISPSSTIYGSWPRGDAEQFGIRIQRDHLPSVPTIPLGEQHEQIVRHLRAAGGDQMAFQKNAALDIRIDGIALWDERPGRAHIIGAIPARRIIQRMRGFEDPRRVVLWRAAA